ncbi:hypothetical protein [Arthrospiribacter ruber]|nr:hypothetical protein [Arthrospiribacter ruber]
MVVDKVLNFIINSVAGHHADQQTAMHLFGFLFDKTALQLISEGLLSKGDDPGWLKLFYQEFQKCIEMRFSIYAGFCDLGIHASAVFCKPNW